MDSTVHTVLSVSVPHHPVISYLLQLLVLHVLELLEGDVPLGEYGDELLRTAAGQQVPHLSRVVLLGCLVRSSSRAGDIVVGSWNVGLVGTNKPRLQTLELPLNAIIEHRLGDGCGPGWCDTEIYTDLSVELVLCLG